MRGAPSKQPTSTGTKGGPSVRTTPGTNANNQPPRNNDPRHIPREFK